MIKQTFDHNIYIEICDKLKDVKNCKLKANTLYAYMLDKDTFTYTSHDKDKMNGCLVVKSFRDNEGISSLLMLFIWIDPHYSKLHKAFMEIANTKGKELGAKRMYFIANRNEKAIERRTGFRKVYSTYMKEVV